MGIRFTDDEAWDEITRAHTGIYTTLKKDGWPVPLPVWFTVVDRHVLVSTPGRSKKVTRVRNDDRGTFLVERGEKWVELSAVVLPVRATILDDEAEAADARERMHAKYEAYEMPRSNLPEAAAKNYSGMVVIRLEPAGPFVSWDNSRLRLKS